MPLAPGTKFGPYEIVGPLGAGGMGEVFRARDTRLGRDVALKILPDSFANDPDRRGRFEREAQAVAALSHPNVVAIHDTGAAPGAEGTQPSIYVVMELLAGQTLRERLESGAIPVRKAVEIAIQIARGLGAAHGKGLVHRDLKPDNVFLLDDGQVKILDFGLARQSAATEHSGATQTVAATDPGVVLGTMGYMAPEQVRGKAVDARADVFAFGVVLYEMVSGSRAFHRETAADTMSAILNQEPPDLSASRPDLSPALDRIIRHCLEKNPNERFQSARDIAFALEALSGSTVSSPSGVGTAAAVPERAPRRAMPWILVAALVVAATAGGAFLGRTFLSAKAQESLQFTMKTFEPQSIFNARFMPDHETIVFSAAPTGNQPSLYEIRPGTLEARRLGPPDTHLLSISSKGELAVLTGAVFLNHRLFAGQLAQMALDGSPRPLLDHVREADWNPEGTALAVVREVDGRDQLQYPAGKQIYGVDGYLSDPRVSPDGKHVAFLEHPSRFDDRGFVKVVDEAGKVTTLAGEFWGMEGLAWTSGGTSVYFAASDRAAEGRPAGALSYQVYEVRADGSRPAVFALTSPGDFTIHDIAPDGRWLATRDETRFGVAARGAGQAEEHDLTWLNKCWGAFLSPSGDKLMFSDGNGSANYTVTWRKTDGSPITKLGEGDTYGWSPDGRWALGFITARNETVLYPTGAGEPRKLDTKPVTRVKSETWLDSTSLLIVGSGPGQPLRPYRLPIAGGPAVPVLTENVTEVLLAPDHNTVLGFDKNGSAAIYHLDGGVPKPLPSVGDDDPFAFSDDGRAIFVVKPGSIPARVDRIDVATGQRTFFREFGPVDRTSLIRIYFSDPVLKADGSQYAYGYVKRPSTLFMVTPKAK